MNKEEQQFIEQAKETLAKSAAELDSETLAGLSRARAHALARPAKKNWLLWGAAPATGLILAALLIFTWHGQLPQIEKSIVDDLSLLVTEDPLEFYEEIEFYLWLSEDIDENSDFSDLNAVPAAALTSLGHRPGGATGPGTIGVSRCI